MHTLTQNIAHIFLAANRQLLQTSEWRSWRTDCCIDINGFPGNVIAVHDDTLAPGKEKVIAVPPGHNLWLLPVVGSILVQKENKETAISPGDSYWLETTGAKQVSLVNPFTDHLVNYLLVWFRTTPIENKEAINSFQLLQPRNQWHTALHRKNIHASLALLDGRREITASQQGGASFLFMIQGAAEVSGRLLQVRDALLLSEKGIEIEALSQDAICLLIQGQ